MLRRYTAIRANCCMACNTPSCVQFWSALFWVTTVDLLARHLGMTAKVCCTFSYLSIAQAIWPCSTALPAYFYNTLLLPQSMETHLLFTNKSPTVSILCLLQLAVVLSWTPRSAEGFRRRAQCLTWIENLSLLYRAVLPIPVWYKFFEDSGMGMVLCAMTTGECRLCGLMLLVLLATVLTFMVHISTP